MTDSPICSFCKDDLETIEHLFADCHIVKEIWSNIEEWISNKFDRHISFDRKINPLWKVWKPKYL